MSLSPLSFVVVAGIETNKGKLLSLLLLGLQLVSIYHVFIGPESVSDRKKEYYQVISDRILGPELLSGNFDCIIWIKIIISFVSGVSSSVVPYHILGGIIS